MVCDFGAALVLALLSTSASGTPLIEIEVGNPGQQDDYVCWAPRERVHARIAAVQRQHPRVSLDEAREHVLRANPDLAGAYWDSD